MMFTGSPPVSPGGRVDLFFLAEDAQAAVGRGNPVFLVAVHYDALVRRLIPLEPVFQRPGWTAPASLGGDSFVATTEPIPRPLYLVPEPASRRPWPRPTA